MHSSTNLWNYMIHCETSHSKSVRILLRSAIKDPESTCESPRHNRESETVAQCKRNRTGDTTQCISSWKCCRPWILRMDLERSCRYFWICHRTGIHWASSFEVVDVPDLFILQLQSNSPITRVLQCICDGATQKFMAGDVTTHKGVTVIILIFV